MICFQNLDNVTIETGNITDVDVPITDLQSLSEYAVPTMRFVNPLNNDQIVTDAVVGENIRLLIQIPEQYRINFDVKVVECKLDDEFVLQNGFSITPYLPNPAKDEQGVVYMDFALFRRSSFIKRHRLTMQCLVETCVNSCDAEPILRRRRREARFVPFYLYRQASDLIDRMRSHKIPSKNKPISAELIEHETAYSWL